VTAKSRRPTGGKSSRYVIQQIGVVGLRPRARILDVPAGYGRHALALAALGHQVVAADLEPDGLKHARGPDCLPVVLDATRDLPFPPSTFDLVLVVHFLAPRLIERAAAVLRPGGHLLLESFGGQGENWRALPAEGEMRAALQGHFELRDYVERLVGPTRSEAVSVRFLARLI
jgi:SAM-dependent methyltransferase